jgi:hypothetical protein
LQGSLFDNLFQLNLLCSFFLLISTDLHVSLGLANSKVFVNFTGWTDFEICSLGFSSFFCSLGPSSQTLLLGMEQLQ